MLFWSALVVRGWLSACHRKRWPSHGWTTVRVWWF